MSDLDARQGTASDTAQAREPDAHPVGGFTHDPGLVALVADQIAETYSDDEYQIRPDPDDVIADVMETVRADIRDRAEDQARCGKLDDCTAKALVLTRLADWLAGWSSTDAVQAPDVAALVALADRWDSAATSMAPSAAGRMSEMELIDSTMTTTMRGCAEQLRALLGTGASLDGRERDEGQQ